METATTALGGQNTREVRKHGYAGRRVGRFKIVDLLGTGSVGKVFRALDTALNRQVALKVLKADSREYPSEMFISEARAAAQLEHPNIVTVYEVNQRSDIYYIAMELLEGGSLAQLVKAHGPLDVVRACQVTAEAAEALAYAHQSGIVHRDIKPANLMLARNGRCKIADFGLAHDAASNGPSRAKAGWAGTPQYLAPEVTGGKHATAQSDIYALGATLYCLLAGQPPFLGSNLQELQRQHRCDPVADLGSKGVPAALMQAIRKAMAKDPADRYRGAEDFAKVLRVHTIPVPPGTSVPRSPARNPGSNKVLLLSGVAVAVVATAIVGVMMASSSGPAGARPQAPTASAGDGAGSAHPAESPTYTIIRPVDPPASARKPAEPAFIRMPELSSAPVAAPAGTLSAGAPQVAPASGPTASVPLARAGLLTQTSAPATASDAKAPVILATETTELAKIATTNSNMPDASVPLHSVEGVVAKAQTSPSGRVFTITFRNADEGFYCAYFPASGMFQKMQARFGGTNGSGIEGKRIRVTGKIGTYNNRPQILLDSPDQVVEVK